MAMAAPQNSRHLIRSGYKKFILDSDDYPALTRSRTPPERQFLTPQLAPVIIKLMDKKENFRQMKIAERDAVNADIVSQAGLPKDSEIPRGGDLFVYPNDREQQEILLGIQSLAGRPVSCSLPNSFLTHKGFIRGVPTADSIDDIKAALEDQNVVEVYRPQNRDEVGAPSDRLILTFSSTLPHRVKIASMSYEVQQYYPNPYRCRKCWRLGHTLKFCQATVQRCKKCGLSHEESVACQTRCVNCGHHDHEADSFSCPAYAEAKSILKLAIIEDITVKEARLRSSTLYSSITKAYANSRPTNPHQPTSQEISRESSEFALMKAQVTRLEAEM